jgi:hypothetical protein
MLPSHFVILSSLPLNSNGKLDRLKLPEPSFDVNATSFRAPRNEQEMLICSLFSDVTGYEKVGIDDNFFQLAVTLCLRCAWLQICASRQE